MAHFLCVLKSPLLFSPLVFHISAGYYVSELLDFVNYINHYKVGQDAKLRIHVFQYCFI